MDQANEVVITGLGVVSPIGVGTAAFWDALCSGRSGVRSWASVQGTGMPVTFAAQVADFDAKAYVTPRKSLKVMCREIQMGFAAAVMALEDAQLRKEQTDPDRFGVIYAAEMFYGDLEELLDAYRNCMVDGQFQFSLWGTRLLTDIFPLWMLKYLPNMVACHVGIAQDARGPNNSIVLGEASSLLALSECARVIERGHADVMIAGGTGSRLNVPAMLFRGDSNLSHRADEPARASRPFDADRDGMVNGEGAAVVILERAAHARARGARPLARVLGHGSSFEAVHPNRPRTGDGMRRAIRVALASSQRNPHQLDHVNAHGISTRDDDRAEAEAIRDLLGEIRVTAPKGFFGNLGAGGGMVELCASLAGLPHQLVPHTLNYETPDPACPVEVIRDTPARLEKPTFLAVNQSGTGQAAAVVVEALT